MKTLQFTIPVAHDKTLIVQEDILPHFYPYLHRHHEAQLMWIIEGKGSLIADNAIHPFQENDVFLLGANQSHVFKSNSDYFAEGHPKAVRSISVFFNPDGQLASLFNLPEMNMLQQFVRDHNKGFKVPDEDVKQITRRIALLKQAKAVDQLMHFFYLLLSLCKISHKLNPLSGGVSTYMSDSEGMRISEIYAFIAQNFSKSITLEDVAYKANLTPQAFCRYFKKHTGKTFVSFLNEMRVHEASKQLASRKCDSISCVAYSAGFNSITNFNRVFKSIIGKSPKEYMENMQRSFAFH
ncbi:AraC family transcriptional regulator [Olivibacter sitiensis]|uniref:AraC family transcriptional regulator n=1 Tax=Olivibacter sitiensis TaxID=376470 RepID=UPI000416BF94|nr:AraC family transcriptional regulator [Olivibacter sitiensis]